MTSQKGSQITTVHLLPNMSQSKCNETTKFSQLIDKNRNILKNHEENDSGRLVQDLFLFLKSFI